MPEPRDYPSPNATTLEKIEYQRLYITDLDETIISRQRELTELMNLRELARKELKDLLVKDVIDRDVLDLNKK